VAFRRLIGLFALFSGFALLLNIIAGVSLGLALGATAAVLLGGVGLALRGQDRASRQWTIRTASVGALTGIVATVCYDISKAILSTLDPSPYNPFEAVRIFGQLLLGTDASALGVLLAGGAFHFLNGIAFAVAYTFLFARDGRTTVRRAALSGMGWGLFLEIFQLTLYPGWLNVGFYSEFVTISALSHLVYGAIMGVVARAGLQRVIAED